MRRTKLAPRKSDIIEEKYQGNEAEQKTWGQPNLWEDLTKGENNETIGLKEEERYITKEPQRKKEEYKQSVSTHRISLAFPDWRQNWHER